MKKSQTVILWIAAAILAVLVASSALLGHKHQVTARATGSAAGSDAVPSYEETVAAEQKRWGHGHTFGDNGADGDIVKKSGSGYPTLAPAAK